MKEIEVKASLKDEQKVLSKLGGLECVLSGPVKQIDTVYTKVVGDLEDYLQNEHFVRIREMANNENIFTVKIPRTAHKSLVKTEHETKIEDAKELEQMLFMMGYQVANKVIKLRRFSRYQDYEICIDEVEGLGSFIEVEKMIDSNTDHSAVLEELRTFLVSLGVDLEDEIKKGYDIMMIEKMFAK